MPNGLVLIAGGAVTTHVGFHDDVVNQALATAELYNPAAGQFSPTGVLATARAGATATLLSDGNVLIVGGCGSTGSSTTSRLPTLVLTSAELYDPQTGAFSPTGPMSDGRSNAIAILLQDGRVLVVGGNDSFGQPLASAELYDPSTGTFGPTGSMSSPRIQASVTLLPDGQVLVAGGRMPGTDSVTGMLASAELYDPATGVFMATGSMSVARAGHTATLLDDGLVLMAGGATNGNRSVFLASAELYDPSSGIFHPAGSMTVPRVGHSATLLWGGQVLIDGGDQDPFNGGYETGELYDPRTGTFRSVGRMPGGGAHSSYRGGRLRRGSRIFRPQ